MTISASMVKELREKTSAGMLDCKKALQETTEALIALKEAIDKTGTGGNSPAEKPSTQPRKSKKVVRRSRKKEPEEEPVGEFTPRDHVP